MGRKRRSAGEDEVFLVGEGGGVSEVRVPHRADVRHGAGTVVMRVITLVEARKRRVASIKRVDEERCRAVRCHIHLKHHLT